MNIKKEFYENPNYFFLNLFKLNTIFRYSIFLFYKNSTIFPSRCVIFLTNFYRYNPCSWVAVTPWIPYCIFDTTVIAEGVFKR